MAVIARQRYKLDIAPSGGWVIVYASQHDNGAREIEFEITNQGRAFSIPASINVSVQGIKSNGSYFSHSCSYSGNIVTMALADDMTDIIGKSICVLKFTNSSQQKLATAKFVLNVDTDSSSEGVIIDTEAEEIFNQMLNEIRAQAASVSADIAELQSMVGSPLVASTASAMTDHNKIYVYVGSESGYVNGNWYYWNGSAWTSGGVYNAVAFETDKTLSVENMPADALSTGHYVYNLLEEVFSNNVEIDNGFPLFSGGVNINTGANVDTSPYNTTRCRSGYKVIDKARWELRNNQYEWMAYSYSSNTASTGVRLVSDWVSGETDILIEKEFESELYIRFCFRKLDGSVFTTSGTGSDYETIQNSVKKYIATIKDVNDIISNEPNIFKLTNTLDRTVNGISLTVQSRDTLSFNGKVTAKTRYYLLGGNGSTEINLPAGKYIFSRTLVSGTASSNPFFAYTDSTHTEQSILLNIEKEFTEDATILLIVNSGYNFSNAKYIFEIREAGTTAVDNVSRGYINKHSKSIKILGIGNSYTRDSVRWLCKILLDAGYNAVVAHAYWGASTLAEQYASLDPNDANHSIFQIRKYDNAKNFSSLDNMPLETLLADEKWDVVIFQQQSDEAGQYSSFVSSNFDINDFISYVKTAIGNDNLKIGIALTWSHAHGYTGEKFVQYYGGDPTVQYDAIKQTIPQVANHMSQCDFIVNVGDAVEYGRDNIYLSTLGTELLRTDKNHLYYGIPSYMAGLVYAMTICGINGTESTWYPTAEDEGVSGVVTSANYARIARQCARKAVLSLV